MYYLKRSRFKMKFCITKLKMFTLHKYKYMYIIEEK